MGKIFLTCIIYHSCQVYKRRDRNEVENRITVFARSDAALE